MPVRTKPTPTELLTDAGFADRFWARVQKSEGCWRWKGNAPGGYGVVDTRRKGTRFVLRAHRVAWELTNGLIPDGLHALHGCDNKRCVRPHPEHVHLGTHAENMREAAERGLAPSGFRKPNTILRDVDVAAIADSTEPGHELAKRYGVSQQTVCDIRKGRRRAKSLATAGRPPARLEAFHG